MKLHKETWLNKKREGRIFSVSNYILNDPEALVITMLMGFVLTLLIFGGLAVLSAMYGWGWFLVVLFSGIAIFNLYKMWGMIKIIKYSGLKGAMGNMTVGGFVFSKNEKEK